MTAKIIAFIVWHAAIVATVLVVGCQTKSGDPLTTSGQVPALTTTIGQIPHGHR